MRIESKLCHLTENKAVVQVSGWLNEEKLGSALAEGRTVEEAEDKAILRLKGRITGSINKDEGINTIQGDITKETLKIELPECEKIEKVNVKIEPSDWSNELTAIDSEVTRLKWTREDEIRFLEKNLNINNRNKITKYKDLLSYLNMLKKINIDNRALSNNSNITDLIKESELILKELSWDHVKGREYLQKEFNVSTRKELNEKQLISFIEKLKSMRNQQLL